MMRALIVGIVAAAVSTFAVPALLANGADKKVKKEDKKAVQRCTCTVLPSGKIIINRTCPYHGGR